jgi:hypothetical protein
MREPIAALNAKTVDRAAFRQWSQKTAFLAKNSSDCGSGSPN